MSTQRSLVLPFDTPGQPVDFFDVDLGDGTLEIPVDGTEPDPMEPVLIGGPNVPTRMATILPLHYIDPHNQDDPDRNREERSVIVLFTDWDELLPLLEDPRDYLAKVSRDWRREGVADGEPISEFSFLENEPITAVIRPIALQERSIQLTRTLAAPAILGDSLKAMDGDTVVKASTKTVNRELGRLDRKGVFFVEFAHGTSILNINYLPPLQARNRFAFPKQLTKATLGLYPSLQIDGFPAFEETGAVHVDLLNETGCLVNKDRANFVVDLLESRDGLVEALNNPENVEMGNSRLVPPGERIVIPSEGSAPNGIAFALDPKIAFPTVIVEGLSAASVSCVCCVCPVRRAGDDVLLGDFTCKTYVSCPCAQP